MAPFLRLSLHLSDNDGSSNSSLVTNLLSGSAWVEGASTTMTTAAGRVRATRNGGNPRVYKEVTLVPGATYRLTGTCFQGTQSGAMIIRVSASAGLPDGDLGSSMTTHAINNDFIASTTTMYVGMVCVTTNDGEYAEISENLSLVRV